MSSLKAWFVQGKPADPFGAYRPYKPNKYVYTNGKVSFCSPFDKITKIAFNAIVNNLDSAKKFIEMYQITDI